MLITTVAQLDEAINLSSGTVVFDNNSLSPQMKRALDSYAAGNSAWEAGDLSTAIAAHKKTVSEWPNFVAPRVNLADCLLLAGEHDEALAQLKYAHKFAPDDPDIHTSAAKIYGALGKKQNMLNQYKQALADQPDHVRALIGLGAAYRETGDLVESENYLLKALKEIDTAESLMSKISKWVHPDRPDLLLQLALMYRDMEHWSRAAIWLRQYAAFNPNPIVKYWLEEMEEIAGLRLSIRDYKEFAVALLNRGVEYKRKGDLQRAKRFYVLALRTNPFNVMGYYSLAKICYLMNERTESVSNFLRAAHLQVTELINGFSDVQVRLNVEERLRQHSREYITMFSSTHKYAPLLLCNPQVACHLAHVIIDLDDKQATQRGLSSYISQIYRPVLESGVGQVDAAVETEHYLPLGYRFLLENLDWKKIESELVQDLYDDLRPL